jgi:hypothetical protein
MRNVAIVEDLPNGNYLRIEGNEDDGVTGIYLNGNQEVTAEHIDEFQDIDWRYIAYAQKHNL